MHHEGHEEHEGLQVINGFELGSFSSPQFSVFGP